MCAGLTRTQGWRCALVVHPPSPHPPLPWAGVASRATGARGTLCTLSGQLLEDKLSRDLLDSLAKKCPNAACGALIVKKSGCNAMKARFCWTGGGVGQEGGQRVRMCAGARGVQAVEGGVPFPGLSRVAPLVRLCSGPVVARRECQPGCLSRVFILNVTALPHMLLRLRAVCKVPAVLLLAVWKSHRQGGGAFRMMSVCM